MIPTDPAERADYWRRRHDSQRLIAVDRRSQAELAGRQANELITLCRELLEDRDRSRQFHRDQLLDRNHLIATYGADRDRMRSLLGLVAGLGTNNFVPQWLYQQIVKELGL